MEYVKSAQFPPVEGSLSQTDLSKTLLGISEATPGSRNLGYPLTPLSPGDPSNERTRGAGRSVTMKIAGIIGVRSLPRTENEGKSGGSELHQRTLRPRENFFLSFPGDARTAKREIDPR